MTKEAEVALTDSTDTLAQHQQLVQELMERQPGAHPKLEVWYGTGQNGKTTTLSKLLSNFSTEEILIRSVSPARRCIIRKYSGGQQYDLLVVRELTLVELELLDAEMLKFLLSEPTRPTRFVMTTNHLTRFLERSNLTKVYRFPHVFS